MEKLTENYKIDKATTTVRIVDIAKCFLKYFVKYYFYSIVTKHLMEAFTVIMSNAACSSLEGRDVALLPGQR